MNELTDSRYDRIDRCSDIQKNETSGTDQPGTCGSVLISENSIIHRSRLIGLYDRNTLPFLEYIQFARAMVPGVSQVPSFCFETESRYTDVLS